MIQGNEVLITIFRILHIVSGVIWVGSGFVLSLYINPALKMSGVDTSKFMRTLYTKTGYMMLLPIVSILTTVTGFVLYGILSNGFSHVGYMRGTIVLTIGVIFGLLAFGHSLGALGAQSRKYSNLVKAAGDNPTSEQQDALSKIEASLMKNGRISMWISFVALVLMASARYIDPLVTQMRG
jgi:uncharacterized membrane protein